MNSRAALPIHLEILPDGDHQPRGWDLVGKATYVLGRAPTSDVPLPFPWVSRNHAMLQIEENGGCHILDLGSSNGTFVNGRRAVTPTPLHSGDLLGLGKTRLRFQREEPTLAPAMDEDLAEATVAFLKRATVTILVCDIRSFTSFAEQHGPETVSELLKVWSTQVHAAVTRHEGRVDKFIGDAVMAIWGEGRDTRRNIVSALKACLEIAAVTAEAGRQVVRPDPALRIGAALNTGEAVVGNLGVQGGRDYTVVGDAVNVAFRLEDLTSELRADVLLGGETGRHLPEISKAFTSWSLSVRGKEEKVQVFGTSFARLKSYLDSLPP
ncbi:MAG: adenylate/guanylate cyclase domain-containing protein [Thermodesulfobacteriota bacterium]